MGLTRKFLSMSTLGAIDYRSDKERVARSARRTDKASASRTSSSSSRSASTRPATQQASTAYAAPAIAPAPQLPPAGWMPDPQQPTMLRWWDGQRWTEHTQPRP